MGYIASRTCRETAVAAASASAGGFCHCVHWSHMRASSVTSIRSSSSSASSTPPAASAPRNIPRSESWRSQRSATPTAGSRPTPPPVRRSADSHLSGGASPEPLVCLLSSLAAGQCFEAAHCRAVSVRGVPHGREPPLREQCDGVEPCTKCFQVLPLPPTLTNCPAAAEHRGVRLRREPQRGAPPPRRRVSSRGV